MGAICQIICIWRVHSSWNLRPLSPSESCATIVHGAKIRRHTLAETGDFRPLTVFLPSEMKCRIVRLSFYGEIYIRLISSCLISHRVDHCRNVGILFILLSCTWGDVCDSYVARIFTRNSIVPTPVIESQRYSHASIKRFAELRFEEWDLFWDAGPMTGGTARLTSDRM